MFCKEGFLHIVVEGLPDEAGVPSAGPEEDGGAKRPDVESDGAEPTHNVAVPPINGDDCGPKEYTDENNAADSADAGPIDKLSNRQRRKAAKRRKKMEAKERRRQLDEGRTNGEVHSTSRESSAKPTPRRLHQFVSTAFRSELNVAENGTGHFIKNAPRVSAHHALIQGAVKLNGEVCKMGRVALRHGDVVSLQLEAEGERKRGELVSWKGSEDVAKSLEGNALDARERKGRMMASTHRESVQKVPLEDCDMVKYYREKLGRMWIPDVHERAMTQPLPLTLRVLRYPPGQDLFCRDRSTPALDKELAELGFRPVVGEDFSVQACSLDGSRMQQLSKDVMQELLRDTWILDSNDCDRSEASKKKLGVFLSEARVSGEIMQQELTSMIPVAILAAHMNKQAFAKGQDLRFLDLCAAPGSKTCQLLSTLERRLQAKNRRNGVDFTVVANELSPQRASWMQHRLHQQSGSSALSNLIVTCADGCEFEKMEPSSFDFIICDVPCSGDGTVRKSPEILGKWSPKNAEKNQAVQKELLKVGLGLLRECRDRNDGGILVYSTCSLNPAENEAVISEVLSELNKKEGEKFKFELVDMIKEAPTNDGDGNGNRSGRGNDVLRVLPAKSHGGFFVAGIRKIAIACGATISALKKGNSYSDLVLNKLVQPSIGHADKVVVTYSISPCTQRCRMEISERMGSSAVISCGVAIMYEGVDNKKCILQQGCATLLSTGHGVLYGGYMPECQEIAGYIRLSRADMLAGHNKRTAFHEAVIFTHQMCNVTSSVLGDFEDLNSARPLIIVVDSTFLLPVKIVESVQDDVAIVIGIISRVVVEILARPQVLRRALGLE